MGEAEFAIHYGPNAQGIPIPARPLPQKTDRIVRNGRRHPGIVHEADRVTEAAQAQSEFEVLARTDIKPALSHEDVTPVHGAGSGTAGDRFDHVKEGSSRGKGHQVLETLKSGRQRVALVGDVDVAARGRHVPFAERCRHPR